MLRNFAAQNSQHQPYYFHASRSNQRNSGLSFKVPAEAAAGNGRLIVPISHYFSRQTIKMSLKPKKISTITCTFLMFIKFFILTFTIGLWLKNLLTPSLFVKNLRIKNFILKFLLYIIEKMRNFIWLKT